jgi:hypothetical protein
MGGRKSNLANRRQHGNWLKRYNQDGVLIRKRTLKKKEGQVQNVSQIKTYITMDFLNHPDTMRLSSGVPKVQIEGLKLFINQARIEGYNSIVISFQIKEETRSWLNQNSYVVNRKNKRKRKNKNGQFKVELLVSW